MDPKEIPRAVWFPAYNVLVVFTQQLETLVTSLHEILLMSECYKFYTYQPLSITNLQPQE